MSYVESNAVFLSDLSKHVRTLSAFDWEAGMEILYHGRIYDANPEGTMFTMEDVDNEGCRETFSKNLVSERGPDLGDFETLGVIRERIVRIVGGEESTMFRNPQTGRMTFTVYSLSGESLRTFISPVGYAPELATAMMLAWVLETLSA